MTTTNTEGPKEIKLNPPKTFDGSREKFRKFLQDAELYMTINKKLYDTDLVKIGFVLSFMTEGQAAAWADQFVEEAQKTSIAQQKTDIDLGTYPNFRKTLTDTFSAYDSPGEALSQMKNLRMKRDDPIEEHIAKFKSLVSESRIEADSPVIIDMFRETLTLPLQRRILTLESPPTTLKEWCEWAMKIDHNWRRMQLAVGRTQANQQKGKGQQKKFYFPRKERDPNAMDIDRLSMEEREKLMKEGRCFRCKLTGHRANDCPDKNEKKKEEPKKRMSGKELHAHVRSLFKDMTDEEREEFMKTAEDAGF
jgi:Ty3 transposon capsid-like protein/Zinc knuckle